MPVVDENEARSKVEEFILEKIDTVPQIEALLLIWNKRPKAWSVQEMANALYVSPEVTRAVLQDLVEKELISREPQQSGQYVYRTKPPEREDLMSLLDRTYRHELIRISKLIHAKAPSAVEQFARAFRFTREKS